MAIKIYLDTNIILEHALQRKNYLQVSEVFHLAELELIQCYTSASTFFTIAFFLKKEQNSKNIFKSYFSFIKPITTSEESLLNAVNSSFIDIEDAFHYYSAINLCDYFLTFNKKDFIKHSNKRLPCLTPGEFLKILE